MRIYLFIVILGILFPISILAIQPVGEQTVTTTTSSSTTTTIPKQEVSINDVSPFPKLNKNWWKLSRLEKQKVMRQFLQNDPIAWADRQGNTPEPVVLAVDMDPTNRDKAEDYVLWHIEKFGALALAQELVAIINHEVMIKLYEQKPESIKETLREHERYMHRDTSDQAIEKLIDEKLEFEKNQLYIRRISYVAAKKRWLAFEGEMPEISFSKSKVDEINKGIPSSFHDYRPDWTIEKDKEKIKK